MHEFRRQPLKGLYLIYQLVSTLVVRLPLWIVMNIPRPVWLLLVYLWLMLTIGTQVFATKEIMACKSRGGRQICPSCYGYSKSVSRVGFLQCMAPTIRTRTGPWVITPDYKAITPGKGVHGVWIPPAPELITGEIERLAEIANVTSIRVPGYWTTVHEELLPGDKILYNLHGGAYIRMSAHPSDPTANIVKGIVEHVPSIKRAFSVEYRLSSTKPFTVAHPFPTALIDALAGYNYLVNTLHIPPSQIIVCGDSAGGNLAHALTRYLVENSKNPAIPAPPSALILLSPWSDLSKYHDDLPGGSATTCAPSDYIGNRDGGPDWAKDAFCGPHSREIADTHPYISPASLHPGFTISFNGFPRTFIAGGGAEVLIDQIRTLKDRMVKDLGEGNGVQKRDGKVRYHEAPDAIHDYLVFPWHEPERSDTLRAIAEWVDA